VVKPSQHGGGADVWVMLLDATMWELLITQGLAKGVIQLPENRVK
jgi:hypothetical protein